MWRWYTNVDEQCRSLSTWLECRQNCMWSEQVCSLARFRHDVPSYVLCRQCGCRWPNGGHKVPGSSRAWLFNNWHLSNLHLHLFRTCNWNFCRTSSWSGRFQTSPYVLAQAIPAQLYGLPGCYNSNFLPDSNLSSNRLRWWNSEVGRTLRLDSITRHLFPNPYCFNHELLWSLEVHHCKHLRSQLLNLLPHRYDLNPC